jgi:hypothetical protein
MADPGVLRRRERRKTDRRCCLQGVRGRTAQSLTWRLAPLGKGVLRPPLHPPTRAFSRWTRRGTLRSLDPRPGGASPSGHLTAVSAAASTRRAFVPSMDLQTGGDFALPLAPHRQGVCRLDPHHGPCPVDPRGSLRAPAPWAWRPAPAPWSCMRPYAPPAPRKASAGGLDARPSGGAHYQRV